MIQEAGGFDLKFYWQFVRNGLDSTALQPIRRWTRNPSVYLRTVDEAGAPIDAETLDATERMLTETVPCGARILGDGRARRRSRSGGPGGSRLRGRPSVRPTAAARRRRRATAP
jgi:hypothetical protein